VRPTLAGMPPAGLSPAWASACSLLNPRKPHPPNRMNAAEDTGQQFSRPGIAFQLHQFAVQPVEVLVTFDQELLNEISPGRLARNPIVFSARFFARQVASSDSKRECFSVGRWWAPPNRTKV